jgi:hypothetical protein
MEIQKRMKTTKYYHARQSIGRENYEKYYTPELKKIVREFYKDDFKNFSYPE